MQNTPRFLIASSEINNSKFKIFDKSQINKIKQVLRMQSGNRIVLFDGVGTEYVCELEIVSSDVVTGNILEKNIIEQNAKFNITLAQGFPKAGKIEEIVRMCTEVGVSNFVFFESEYSLPKVKDYKENKIERINKIIQEATRQSERSSLPRILELTSFNNLINKEETKTKILLSTHKEQPTVNFSEIKLKLIEDNIKEVMLIIGTEGGFSPKELHTAKEKGVIISEMKLPILRTETAGVVAAGFLLI
ncbi:16S rRNA (uracil(1498)-N(3))-methyltransferase [Candidatus Dojkabacteria bacterium]|nr:16S rRNA (uracil(1498)-N(3))-methyltransferase [Candidatus Dojkabacteria bacterium]